jgi:hypothetical protein
MNRRNFFRNLALGAASLPALAAKPPAPRRQMEYVADIPAEAGKVNCMALMGDHVFVGCDKGLYHLKVK